MFEWLQMPLANRYLSYRQLVIYYIVLMSYIKLRLEVNLIEPHITNKCRAESVTGDRVNTSRLQCDKE